VDATGLDIERDPPKSMHSLFFFAEITLDPFATKARF
jgi:hypothetical protein